MQHHQNTCTTKSRHLITMVLWCCSMVFSCCFIIIVIIIRFIEGKQVEEKKMITCLLYSRTHTYTRRLLIISNILKLFSFFAAFRCFGVTFFFFFFLYHVITLIALAMLVNGHNTLVCSAVPLSSSSFREEFSHLPQLMMLQLIHFHAFGTILMAHKIKLITMSCDI